MSASETFELFERVSPKDGPYPWMVWAVHAMEDHWFRTRKEAEKYIERGANRTEPELTQAAADRSSEAVQANKGKVT